MFKQIGFVLISILLATHVLAEDTKMTSLKNKLIERFPTIVIHEIVPSEVSDIYVVDSNAGIVYVTADAHYAFNGSLIDLDNNGKNLTEARLGTKRLKALERIGADSMLTYSPKAPPKHVVTVFTDVDCGYCRRFHQEVPTLNEQGVEVRYIAFPRAGVGSASYDTMVSVWCADDKQSAMNNAKQGHSIESKTCEHPIDEHLNLVGEFALRGTPTIVFEDGTVAPGYLPAAQLMKHLETIKK